MRSGKKRKGFFRWIKDYVRPYHAYHRNRGDQFEDGDDLGDKFDKLKERLEAGIKFRFRF